MIVSVHIVESGLLGLAGALRDRPDPAAVPGLRYAETTLTAALGGRLPAPRARRAAMIAAWDEDADLERFLAADPAGRRFADGWHARMLPLRVYGAWPAMPGLPESALPVEDDEPVAVLTLGRLRLTRVLPFLRAGSPAEAEVVAEPHLLAAIGLARPPHLVSTFSLWGSVAAMRDYAYREQGAHRAAVRSDRKRPFHHDSAFIRLRPYLSQGSWAGRDPLRGLHRPVPV